MYGVNYVAKCIVETLLIINWADVSLQRIREFMDTHTVLWNVINCENRTVLCKYE